MRGDAGRVRVLPLAGAAAVAVLAGLAVSGTLSAWIQETVYDNRPSGVSCEELPERSEVEAVIRGEPDLVRRIEAVAPDVTVDVVSPCPGENPGGAEVLVQYGGGDARERIEQLLDESPLGVPVSLRNV